MRRILASLVVLVALGLSSAEAANLPIFAILGMYSVDGTATNLAFNGPPIGNTTSSPLYSQMMCGTGAVSAANPCPMLRADPAVIPFASLTATGSLTGVIDTGAQGGVQMEVQIGAANGSTYAFQGTNDTSLAWQSVTCQREPIEADGTQVQSASSNNSWVCPIRYRFFQVALTTYGTASPTGFASQKSVPVGQPPGTVNVATKTTGGWSQSYNMVNLASTNASLISSSAHNVGSIVCTNTGTTAVTVRLFDKSPAAVPVPGTDSPVFQRTIPAGGMSSDTFADVGKYFNGSLGFDMTAGIALLDSTAMGTAAVAQCSVAYK